MSYVLQYQPQRVERGGPSEDHIPVTVPSLSRMHSKHNYALIRLLTSGLSSHFVQMAAPSQEVTSKGFPILHTAFMKYSPFILAAL